MIYCFDLDGTLCTKTEGGHYKEAQPYMDRIAKVNELFKQRHTIIIDTARGTLTARDRHERDELWVMTRNQLLEWGVCYTRLRVAEKIYADVYIDDKGISDKDFFSENR